MDVSYVSPAGLTDAELAAAADRFLADLGFSPRRVLLLPPDMTRLHSCGGKLAAMLYARLADRADVRLMPALGTHEPMTAGERRAFFGDIPDDRFLVHDWRHGVRRIGVVPGAFVSEVSGGISDEDIPVEVDRELLDGGYDLIVSLGQVVPHEVVGMANWSKNIFVGCGGQAMINRSHMLGALYGMERMMGRDRTPVRRVFDYAHEHFLSGLPLWFFQTVTTNSPAGVTVHGLFVGNERGVFEKAVRLAQEKNIIFVDEPFRRVVVYLDPREFKSTWLGNKAVYRTRMAMADGGELIILAPGVRRFGEDEGNDRLIRRYGYVGRERILRLFETERALRENQSAAAHLVHGSSDGRFSVTYCTTLLTRDEVTGVGYRWRDCAEAMREYDPAVLTDGWHVGADGEPFFYISNPALGLWAHRARFYGNAE